MTSGSDTARPALVQNCRSPPNCARPPQLIDIEQVGSAMWLPMVSALALCVTFGAVWRRSVFAIWRIDLVAGAGLERAVRVLYPFG